jgi:hypothetical protein
VRLNYSLEAVASKFPYVKFCKIVVSKIKPGFKDAGLPALVVYQGGEQIQTYVCMTNELGGEKFTDVEVFNFLSK